MTDFAATRLDEPIVRSLLDTDFYKLLMQQIIHALHPRVDATFGLNNRSRVRLADCIDEGALRAQLDNARTISFTDGELAWLGATRFYGQDGLFTAQYLDWLRGYRLPDYSLTRHSGDYVLEFAGRWESTTLWELHALEIVSELRMRSAMQDMDMPRRARTYDRAQNKLHGKIARLRELKEQGPLRVVDFGTRRRHSLPWQRWCNEAMRDGLGEGFAGTSNILLAKELGLPAVGTNGHELAMAYAALAAPDADAMLDSRYRVLEDWQSRYGGQLLIVLPDAYGTTAFLRDAPRWVAKWAGARPDSKEPIAGGEEFIAWWKAQGEDPREKLLIFSDGMDIDSIERTFEHFNGRVRVSYGWGTNLTNDFRGCDPQAEHALEPISLVCKITEVQGRPAVKLSDNRAKATGEPKSVEEYLKIFGSAGMASRDVFV